MNTMAWILLVAFLAVADPGVAAPLTADDFRQRFLASMERGDDESMLGLVRENGPVARDSVEALLYGYVESTTAGKPGLAQRILGVASRLAGFYRLAFQDPYLEERVRLYAGWDPEALRQKHRADQRLVAKPGKDEALAADRLREAAEISRRIGDVAGTADALEMLGDFHLTLRNDLAASSAYREALGLARGLRDRRGTARLLNKLGNTHARGGESVDARNAYREALVIAQTAGEQRLEGQILNNLGKTSLDLGETASALAAYREALAIDRRLGDRSGEATTRTGFAMALASQGEYKAALQHLEEALAVRKELGDAKGMGVTTNNLGALLVELGRPRLALEKHREAMGLFARAADDEGVAASLMNLGTAHFELGEYEASFRYQREALGKYRALGDRRGEAEALGNIGALYHALGETRRALDDYLKARAVLKAIGDTRGEALQMGNLGGIYEHLGKSDEAAAAYTEAQVLAARSGDLEEEGRSLLGLAILAERQGDPSRAERLYQEALALFRRAGRVRGEAIVRGNLGVLFLMTGRPDEALLALEEAVRLASASGDLETQWYAESRMGFVWEVKGDPERALVHYVRAIEILEAIRAGLGRDAPRARFLERRMLAYDQPLKLLASRPVAEPVPPGNPVSRYGRTYGEAAFHLAERGKARAFLELLARARGAAGGAALPANLREKERVILSRVERLERELNDPLRAGPGTEKADALREARTHLEAFVKQVKRTYPAYALLKYPEPVRVTDLPLRSDEVLLAYKVTDKQTFLWVVRGHRIVKALIIPRTREKLREMIRQFRFPLEDPARLPAFSRDLAQELYRLLLAEALEGQDARNHLVILPDDALHLLPFEALIAKQGKPMAGAGEPEVTGPRYIGQDWRIVYYPSATILAINRQGVVGRSRPSLPLFALGDPVYEGGDPRASQQGGIPGIVAPGGALEAKSKDELLRAARSAAAARGYGEFRRLRWTGVEVRRVAAVLGIPATLPALRFGLAATKAAVIESDLMPYRYLHFATHGILAGDLPYLQEPALVLSLVGLSAPQDGFLTMSDVFNLKINADVAVLSACQTALGEGIAGEGIVGLTRAFLYAGASSVLVSLWPVSDESTALFMERFYFHLVKEKLGRAEALRQARNDLRQRFPHPFFWAPFVLMGEAG